MTFSASLLPGKRGVATRDSGSKGVQSTEFDIVENCAIYLICMAFELVSFRFARYTMLTSRNKDETAVHGYGPTFVGSCRVGVSQSHLFYGVVSALQLCLYVSSFFGLIRSLQEILRNPAALSLAVLCIFNLKVLLFFFFLRFAGEHEARVERRFRSLESPPPPHPPKLRLFCRLCSFLLSSFMVTPCMYHVWEYHIKLLSFFNCSSKMSFV